MTRLTTEQVGTMQAAIQMGFTLDEFAMRHRDWDQEELASLWAKVAAEINSTELKSGQYWGIPSEWS